MLKRSITRLIIGVAVIAATTTALSKPLPPIDVDAAMKAWGRKVAKGETTATVRKNVRAELVTLAKKPANQLEENERWKLLNYLHELDWNRLNSYWKNWYLDEMPNPRLGQEQTSAILKRVASKRFWEITPKELDVYLGWAHANLPNLRDRVVHLARKRVGQPYEMYLLGEFPFEIYDTQPLFELRKSDCVVFCEHTYAMALSKDWKEFFLTLQKIRYKEGQIGLLTRNHYTEADWNKNNAWLVKDVTRELGASRIAHYTERIDREKFFAKFGIGKGIPVQNFEDDYLPADVIHEVVGKLQDGDFVNVVRGSGHGTNAWVGHTGLIAHNDKGEVTLIHSTQPKVVEVLLLDYVQENVKNNEERKAKGKPLFLGLKFLRLRAEELQK